jgi:hypothetical protein
MSRIKSVLLLALVALVATALVGTAFTSARAAHAASSHKVSMKVTKTCAPKGDKICSTYGGKPFGTCVMKGTLVIPNSLQTWTCKGGSFKLTGHGTTGAANDAAGTWKLSKGTGKFKGIRGHGRFKGKLSTGKFTYTGTASY